MMNDADALYLLDNSRSRWTIQDARSRPAHAVCGWRLPQWHSLTIELEHDSEWLARLEQSARAWLRARREQDWAARDILERQWLAGWLAVLPDGQQVDEDE